MKKAINALRAMVTVAALAVLFACGAAEAAEVAGVRLLDAVQVEAAPQAMPTVLLLNGAGVRKKFFMSIYVGALYLPSRTKDAAAALSMPGHKQVAMHILYSELSRDKLAAGWREGFEANSTEAELGALKERLEAFSALLPDVKKGDVVTLDMSPSKGVTVGVNGAVKGVVQGEDFSRTLLKVWLGAKPADDGLKSAMLGGK